MKKLLMTTALVSSFAAASTLAHEGRKNYMIYVNGSPGSVNTRDLFKGAEQLHELRFFDVHRATTDLPHTDGRLEASLNREVTQEELDAARRKVEEVAAFLRDKTPGVTEVRIRLLNPADTQYLVREGKEVKK